MIAVSRKARVKPDAYRIAGWMGKAKMQNIKIEGSKGKWLVRAESDTLGLSAFVCMEVRYESKAKGNA